ncbi:BadF/BadG/BcrA/BcrD ATPase family protein [Streptomyces sp. YIM 130001]|uniref:N-acetylglucosamine kinase n=1 Tax=Streptomyces sp. YIM 130001 TaxID=2259644 RepID=UPI000EE5D2C5|nr:BadF/BadG/BcrA/BcrD ATPase family protein [Streptomyces sp. YIM 130001]RII15616.1 BadF/BadG/BcrA/BcrD ATPase family protein [Streptomyces sp. YIM 130001]
MADASDAVPTTPDHRPAAPHVMFLGVDGGGTKTAFCLIDASGEVRAEATGPGISPANEAGADGSYGTLPVLSDGVARVCADAGITGADVAHAFFGLPAHGESPALTAALDAVPGTLLGHDRYAVGNDMVCAWAGSLGLTAGINVVSGTGSIAYGERAGVPARSGGWGELFGDEGSAYWIAVQGLNAFTRMSDGRLNPGPLAEILRRRLGLGTDLDVVGRVLYGGLGRDGVAALSRPVDEAAELGDTAAQAILLRAGQELALLADTTRRRLGFPATEQVPVSYSGGVFGARRVVDAFQAELRRSDAYFDVRPPLYEPVIGAALHAASLAGTPLTRTARLALGSRQS